MEIRYQLLQKQKQMLSHQQLQSLNILAMDNIELSAFLQSEYLENPMLEQNSTPENPFSKIGAIEPSDEQEKWNHQIEELEDLRSYLKNILSNMKVSGFIPANNLLFRKGIAVMDYFFMFCTFLFIDIV